MVAGVQFRLGMAPGAQHGSGCCSLGRWCVAQSQESLRFAAAFLAIIGVLRRERRAVALTALGVAALVVVWQYIAIGIVAIFVLLLLLNLAV